MANKKIDALSKKNNDLDEEISEVLIAISVISKRLAKKLKEKQEVKRNGRTHETTR